jgi:hypothetical protein
VFCPVNASYTEACPDYLGTTDAISSVKEWSVLSLVLHIVYIFPFDDICEGYGPLKGLHWVFLTQWDWKYFFKISVPFDVGLDH